MESLGKYYLIFQEEVHTIEICVRKIMSTNPENRSIDILLDSKAALLALTSTEVKSKMVWDCIKLNKELSTDKLVTLIWVPGHLNVFGNETADTLVNEGANLTYTGPEPFCGLSLNHVKTIFKSTGRCNTIEIRLQVCRTQRYSYSNTHVHVLKNF